MRGLRIIVVFFIVVIASQSVNSQTHKDSVYVNKYFDLFQVFEYTDPVKARIYVDSGLYYAKRTLLNIY